jgi:hypothetical protein
MRQSRFAVFPVWCARCQAKGVRTVIGQTTCPDSHGMCVTCAPPRGEMKASRGERRIV